MSYLDQFLKETNSTQQQVPPTRLLYLEGGSIESEEGDIEDNRASIASSKSNLSELSIVRKTQCALGTSLTYDSNLNLNKIVLKWVFIIFICVKRKVDVFKQLFKQLNKQS